MRAFVEIWGPLVGAFLGAAAALSGAWLGVRYQFATRWERDIQAAHVDFLRAVKSFISMLPDDLESGSEMPKLSEVRPALNAIDEANVLLTLFANTATSNAANALVVAAFNLPEAVNLYSNAKDDVERDICNSSYRSSLAMFAELEIRFIGQVRRQLRIKLN